MTDLNADIDAYLLAALLNEPPPLIESDPLVSGTTPIEELLRILGLAANADDPEDYAEGLDSHSRREAATTDAAEKFAAQDQAAVGQLAQVASGIAGAVAGALGGALQPLAQIPQQIGQGAGQALQAGLGMFGGIGPGLGRGALGGTLDSLPHLDEFDSGATDLEPLETGSADESGPAEITDAGGLGSAGGAPAVGALTETAPTVPLGPSPVPGALPSSTPAVPAARSGAVATAPGPGPGMAGMPLVPPAMNSAVEKDGKADTKRVSVPPVRNGAPVQGRLTPLDVPEAGAVRVDGYPVTTQRVRPRDSV